MISSSGMSLSLSSFLTDNRMPISSFKRFLLLVLSPEVRKYQSFDGLHRAVPLLRRPRRGCRLRFREWRMPRGYRAVAAIKWASLGVFSVLSQLAGYSFST